MPERSLRPRTARFAMRFKWDKRHRFVRFPSPDCSGISPRRRIPRAANAGRKPYAAAASSLVVCTEVQCARLVWLAFIPRNAQPVSGRDMERNSRLPRRNRHRESSRSGRWTHPTPRRTIAQCPSVSTLAPQPALTPDHQEDTRQTSAPGRVRQERRAARNRPLRLSPRCARYGFRSPAWPCLPGSAEPGHSSRYAARATRKCAPAAPCPPPSSMRPRAPQDPT